MLVAPVARNWLYREEVCFPPLPGIALSRGTLPPLPGSGSATRDVSPPTGVRLCHKGRHPPLFGSFSQWGSASPAARDRREEVCDFSRLGPLSCVDRQTPLPGTAVRRFAALRYPGLALPRVNAARLRSPPPGFCLFFEEVCGFLRPGTAVRMLAALRCPGSPFREGRYPPYRGPALPQGTAALYLAFLLISSNRAAKDCSVLFSAGR